MRSSAMVQTPFSSRGAQLAVMLLALIAVFATLEFAQGLFAPVIAALVVGVVAGPAVDALVRFGIPEMAAAIATMIALLCGFGLLFLAIEPSLSLAVARAPLIWIELESLLRLARDAVAGVQELQETVADALSDDTPSEDNGSETPVEIPSLMDALSYGPMLLASTLVFVGTLFFFLGGRGHLYAQIERTTGWLSQRRLCRAERAVSKYFVTITMINAGLGVLVATVMMVIGLPQPVLWGLGAFLLNYILYLGPALFAAALLLAGLVTFNGAMVFVPMGAFLLINMIEANFATPSLVGRNMSLNPLTVFLSLVFWLWLWGPIGGLVAIPLLVWGMQIAGTRKAITRARARNGPGSSIAA
ncbi:AI-2E family transporter [Tropicimonas sp. S265A]|uniref:AI-2E family transporter n=1 Tax=Tropicimonas sp. S265A TaxID=3415134 RepID=UPI003C7D67A1